jgi:hypothetical protein
VENELLVYKILARGLLDIRIASHEGNSRVAFEIADLLHNVPRQLERVRKEGADCVEILDWIRMRAEQKGIIKWLDNALSSDKAAREAPQ